MSTIVVRLGSILSHPQPDSAAVLIEVDRVLIHPGFSRSPYIINDVALLRLRTPVTFSDTIRPICLPAFNEDPNKLQVCVSTGFGSAGMNCKYF